MRNRRREFYYSFLFLLYGGSAAAFATENTIKTSPHWLGFASQLNGEADVVITAGGQPVEDHADYSGAAWGARFYTIPSLFLEAAYESRTGTLDVLQSEITLDTRRLGAGYHQSWVDVTPYIETATLEAAVQRAEVTVKSQITYLGMPFLIESSGFSTRAESALGLTTPTGWGFHLGGSVRIDQTPRDRVTFWALSKTLTDGITVSFGSQRSDGGVGDQFSAKLREFSASVVMMF